MSDFLGTPADAKKILFNVLKTEGILIVPQYVAQDLASVRRAFPTDEGYSAALLAIAKEIAKAFRTPDSYGSPTSFKLEGWRRSKFASTGSAEANLRLIFRPAQPSGIEILAFGERTFPFSVYRTSTTRVS